MEPSYFYARDGQQVGPVLMRTLQQMGATGQLIRTDLIWSEGWPQWRAAGDFPGIFPVGPPPIQPTAHSSFPAAPYPRYQSGASSNGLAVAGLVCSFLFPIGGLVISWIALDQMKKSGNPEGRGMAQAGLIISGIVVGLGLLWIIAVATCFGSIVHHAGTFPR